MLRDKKILCRSENIPLDSSSSTPNLDSDPNRPPLNAIQDPIFRRKVEKTPSKTQTRAFSDAQYRTPEKTKNRFGWAPNSGDSESSAHLLPLKNGSGCNFAGTTPRNNWTGGKPSSVQSDCSSTQSTPTKSSVTKPSLSGFGGSRPPMSVGRAMVSKGMPMSGAGPSVYVAAEVLHFELREDPSFWMDHNVQVVIRVRPINNTERNLQGYSRCLKQESAQNINWVGQPETRFTFDYVACETISQEMLFRVAGLPMIENCMSGYNSCMFAYGQTGSGKTYTMLGEIGEPELIPSADRGMTPRIFEFLFARIKAEEESRRDEKLKYNCKCSFLEIYNEQITDLLDPCSTNLLLREDIRKGVYVENLTEFEVETVSDILKLLFQGAANRKVAATNMNRESSRSHSVFTCVIESRWEKDSTTNLRFARLNLVDLAGSERQKTSGAEGERLKEAANINKSLSTLGHVIMILADAAHGKQRHVPYRDSRLTFLLQESLGGNSKTMIIANISPSICSANETLSTLKFAQRARLIQNNAVVNEDASGDISALQHQIRLLKEELLLLKRQNISRSLTFRTAIIENSKVDAGDESVMEDLHGPSQLNRDEIHNFGSCQRVSAEQFKSLEATLAGALRREKMADITIKQLEAEIEQLNRLVHQREEDSRNSKMMLKFREDKIYRMEALLDGQLPPDSYFSEENSAQSEEIHLLRARANRNPEVTRFALENIRLLNKLRRFQDFYEEGERELLLSEVAELRNQLILILDGKLDHDQQSNQDLQTQVELENMDLCLDSPHSSPLPPYSVNHAEEVLNLLLELDILKIILGEEKSARIDLEKRAFEAENELRSANERILQHESMENELKDARSVFKALESQHILSINELEELRESNKQFLELLKKQEQEMNILKKQIGDIAGEEKVASCRMLKNQSSMHTENDNSPLQEKLKKIQSSLEKARNLNTRFQSDQVSQTSLEQEKDEVRRQVEVETTEVIVCLQEELISLQQQVDESNRNEVLARQSLNTLETELKGLHERLSLVTEENERLECLLGEKEQALKLMLEDWGRLAYEIAEVLEDGNVSLEDVSDQVASISDSFPSRWVTDQVEKIIRSISEKDSIIDELQKCLDDAQNVKCDMEWKLKSLRGATLAITEVQQKESSEKEREIVQLTSQLSQKMSIISELENNIRLGEERLRKAGICATVAFTIVDRFSDINAAQLNEFVETLTQRDALLQDQVLRQVDAENQMQAMRSQLTQFQEQTHRLLIQLEQSRVAGDNQALARLEIKDATFSGDESDNLLEDKLKLNEFKVVVSKLHSCRSGCAEKVSCPTEEFIEDADDGSEHRIEIESNGDTVCNEQHNIRSVSGGSTQKIVSQNKSECEWLSHDVLDRETTIALLRKELESALNSLKGVQAKMVKLLDEKEEIKQSELQSQKNIEDLTAEVLRLKLEIVDKEQQFELRLLELDEKLQRVEAGAATANVCWCKMKEGLDSEVSNAKAIATQKTIEVSNLLLKIEEVQETMRDADLKVNALMEASETAKLEVERHKSIEAILNYEKSRLTSEVKTLQSSLEVMRQEYMSMKENSTVSLEEARSLFLSLEDTFRLLQGTFTEKFKLVESDLNWLKSQLRHSAQSVRAWLEEIWSEIIGKDCAVSVLHLCHMGILLERITGLNAENGFLYHGLCKSNSVVADLKKHNSKAKQELELCSILKGKLLVDINNSFYRITKKEDETTEFKARLNSFEEKIVHLQLQEESMLDRSNSMGAELAILMKELDESKRNASTTFLAKEQLLKENEDLNYQLEKALKLLDEVKSINVTLTRLLHEEFSLLTFDSQPYSSAKLIDLNTSNINFSELVKYCKTTRCQNESVITNMFAKDFESVVLSSELRQNTMRFDLMVSQKLDIERQRDTFGQIIEKMKGEIVLNKIDVELRHGEMHSILIENEIIENDLLKVKEEHSRANRDLQEQKKMFASTVEHVRIIDEENLKLHDIIGSSQACTVRLQADMDKKSAELTHILKELELKNVVNEIQIKKTHAVQRENDYLKDELVEYERKIDDYTAMLRHCYDITESSHMTFDKMLSTTDNQILLLKDRISRESSEHKELASKFIDELDFLELSSKELMSKNFSLQSELFQKDELSKGYLSDMRLLQESASIAKDQKNELEGVLESLRDEFEAKSCELDEGIARRQLNQSLLLEKNERIVVLDLELAEKQSAVELISSENLELKAHMEHVRIIDEENLKLHDIIGSSQACTARLQADMDKKSAQLTHILKELELKNVVNEIQIKKTHAVQRENDYLKDELVEYKQKIDDYTTMLRHCYDITESSHMTFDKMLSTTDNQILLLKDRISRESSEHKELASKFIDELDFLELSSKELMSKNFSLQSELFRKDELSKGYLSDMRLLQESASIAKDQKNELEGVLESLRDELEAKSCELDEGIACRQLIQSLLLEKNERIVVLELELAEKQSAVELISSENLELKAHMEHVRIIDEENLKLHDIIGSSQACTARLQADMDKKSAELTHILKELELKNVVNEIQIKKTHAVHRENDYLKDELVEYKQKIDDYTAMLRHCYDITESLHMTFDKMLSMTINQILLLKDRISQESSKHKELASKFIDELDFLELSSKELMSKNFSLQSELLRKDELSKGYLSDMRLLQESASIAKDQKNELEGVLESLRDELEAKSCELDEGIAHRQLIQSLLLEKNERIVVLELELAEKQSAVDLISSENLELKAHMEHLLEMRNSIEEELTEKTNVTKKFEDDILEMSNLLGQRNQLVEDLRDETIKLKEEKDHLDSLVLILKEKMEMAHALAEEHEAIATESRQIAEERRVYAADKEEEIKLLERSIEELECTINALENKAEFVRGEAERQRLKREKLEMELESVRHQMLAFPASANNIWQVTEDRNLDIARHLKEKVIQLQEAQKNILVLQKEVADKDAEILQCKTHISELNVHAEAQASEYKQKFKELQAMAQQVKADTISSNPTNLISTKSDKSAAKSRGSGSPFRCIGLGVTQQISSEKDEDLSAARCQIEELEAIAASRQKEIFMLNSRLAAAESMTHDVIRDLLGVKLDMTSCAALLDRDQIQKVNETSKHADQENHEKDELVAKLKKQLHKFIEERESWLNEINQRHTEMVSARIALEKLQQREQFLTTETEMLEMDNGKYKKAVMELEDEVKKLSEQPNLHQRIHHHAKIKEENKLLRIHNEDLHAKLERSDSMLSRVRDELARYRAACGKKPFVDIDKEEQLRKKLDDSEEERIQLAQQLLSLCTCILKMAGLLKPKSIIDPSEAEDALCRIKEKMNSLESEVQDLKLKCKLFCEKIWLSKLKQLQLQSPGHPSLDAYHHGEAVEMT